MGRPAKPKEIIPIDTKRMIKELRDKAEETLCRCTELPEGKYTCDRCRAIADADRWLKEQPK